MYHVVVFIELNDFAKCLKRLPDEVADEVVLHIQRDLMADPLRGDLVPGLGGVRKARVRDPGRQKGSRGGFRYMYFYVQLRGRVYLMFLYRKGEQADINPQERRRLQRVVEDLKRELG